METGKKAGIIIDNHILVSESLERKVKIDVYFPDYVTDPGEISLLLINDGQNLPEMTPGNRHPRGLAYILEELYSQDAISPLLCVGIHAGPDRKNEYGTSNILDYKGHGTKAAAYARFVFEELIPFIRDTYKFFSFREKSFCGFSLGALSALDIVWSHPAEFSKTGLFSASLWWRILNQDHKHFDESVHRIMHMKVKNGNYYPWLKFFFETGTLDETADRNGNGIIDSIDDTLSLIDELVFKGYDREEDIKYIELKDGKHDVATWGRAFPEFLKWGWGRGGNYK